VRVSELGVADVGETVLLVVVPAMSHLRLEMRVCFKTIFLKQPFAFNTVKTSQNSLVLNI